jgi:hypothetical protein
MVSTSLSHSLRQSKNDTKRSISHGRPSWSASVECQAGGFRRNFRDGERLCSVWDPRVLTTLQLCTVQFIMYSFAATFVKLSILFLYRRLFWMRDSTRYMIWIGAITITLFYMASLVTSMVYCIPRNGEAWVSQSAIKRCAQPCLRISVAQGLFGIISDFYLLVIPMLRVSMLRITIWRKVGLAGLFLTGLLWVFVGSYTCNLTVC